MVFLAVNLHSHGISFSLRIIYFFGNLILTVINYTCRTCMKNATKISN